MNQMNPTFTIKLEQQVLSGLAVTGKFDGKVPSLACATTGGKILIHSPHEVTNNEGQLNAVRYLNLNRKITALAAGSLAKVDAVHRPDMIFVGSPSNLMGYDVERNADAFFVDVQDGVNSLVLGRMGSSPKPLVIAGGNCSVLGFDDRGSEAFWTVTGDNVSSMTICDLNSNAQNLLLVGSEDYEIRVFHHEELVKEITEADKVNILEPVGKSGKFAYGLANGTVGLYVGANNRLWRVKTKNKVTAVHAYDIDMDGVPEIFSGWSNGAFVVRREDTGEAVFRQSMGSPVASIVSADYRMDGKEEVMICSEAGEVRAFLAQDMELKIAVDNGIAKDNAADQQVLAELQSEKLEILAEMKLLERSMKMSQSSDLPVGALPPNTNLKYSVEGDMNIGAVALRVEVTTDVQIMNLIAVDLEGVVLVDREILAIAPKPQSRVATLPMRPAKYSPCSLRIQTHVAARSLGGIVHVFETTITLPRFASFKYIDEQHAGIYPVAEANVTFALKDSLDRMLSWVQTSFIAPRLVKNLGGNQMLVFAAVCTPPPAAGSANAEAVPSLASPFSRSKDTLDGDVLSINMRNVSEGGQSYLRVSLHTENMDLAAELMQDIMRYFKLEELESEARFPAVFSQFEEVVTQVAECNAARISLAADMADDSQRIKALVVRAEDARIMNDMETMRKAYTELNALNGQLISGYNIRAQNQANLLSALKEVNQMIQRAANLRSGKAKARLIAEARAAVKNNNFKSLFKIFQQGFDPSSMAAQPKFK